MAGAEDRVFLRRISGLTGPERYELLDHRPIVRCNDTIEVPGHEIDGLTTVASLKAAGRTIYVLKNNPWSRFEVSSLAPGVSYLQSLGLGGGPRLGTSSGTRDLAAGRAGNAGGAAGSTHSVAGSQVKKRPFGWPAYDNPLERPARR